MEVMAFSHRENASGKRTGSLTRRTLPGWRKARRQSDGIRGTQEYRRDGDKFSGGKRAMPGVCTHGCRGDHWSPVFRSFLGGDHKAEPYLRATNGRPYGAEVFVVRRCAGGNAGDRWSPLQAEVFSVQRCIGDNPNMERRSFARRYHAAAVRFFAAGVTCASYIMLCASHKML